MGAHPPQPPARGLAPPGPPLPTLASSGFAGVLGPTRGGVANVGNSPPLLNLWGDTPHNPPPGGLCPLDPRLPTLASSGFAGVLGPTRGGFANVGNSPSFKVLGGTSPRPPGMGLRPLHPRIKVGEGRPFSKRLTSVGVNGTPPRPRRGACAPWAPVCPPSLAEGSPGFGVLTSPRPEPRQIFPLPSQGRGPGG